MRDTDGASAGFRRRIAAASWLPLLVGGCLIQRPPVPPEFLDVRYEVSDSVADAAAAQLRGDTAAQQIVRERLPDYAAEHHVDTLIARLEADPMLAPIGLKVRQIVDAALARASGRVRGALPHPDAQRQLIEAVVLGLGMALRRTEGSPSVGRGRGGATGPP